MTVDYKVEAEQALAVAIIKDPNRKSEFEGNKNKWITAYTFYREENEGIRARGGYPMTDESITSQLMGIDFNKPLEVTYIPPPPTLVQFQAPTTEGKLPKSAIGNYWAIPGQKPAELGLSDVSKLRDPDKPFAAKHDAENVKRTAYQFEPTANVPPVRALKSVAGPIVDNWSRRTSWEPHGKVVPVITPGGGQQLFAPAAKEIMNLKPGQEQKHHDDKYEDKFARTLQRQQTGLSPGLARFKTEQSQETTRNESSTPRLRR